METFTKCKIKIISITIKNLRETRLTTDIKTRPQKHRHVLDSVLENDENPLINLCLPNMQTFNKPTRIQNKRNKTKTDNI